MVPSSSRLVPLALVLVVCWPSPIAVPECDMGRRLTSRGPVHTSTHDKWVSRTFRILESLPGYNEAESGNDDQLVQARVNEPSQHQISFRLGTWANSHQQLRLTPRLSS